MPLKTNTSGLLSSCEKGPLIFSSHKDKYIRMEILTNHMYAGHFISLCAVIQGSFIINLRAAADIIESVHIQPSCEMSFCVG